MINKDLINMTDKLYRAVKDQQKVAKEHLGKMPEGDAKKKLSSLFKRASNGDIKMEDAISEIQKIQRDAY